MLYVMWGFLSCDYEEVCCLCLNCEDSLWHLLTRVALLEKQLELVISRTDMTLKDVKHTESLQHGSVQTVLDKAFKDAIDLLIVVYGVIQLMTLSM